MRRKYIFPTTVFAFKYFVRKKSILSASKIHHIMTGNQNCFICEIFQQREANPMVSETEILPAIDLKRISREKEVSQMELLVMR